MNEIQEHVLKPTRLRFIDVARSISIILMLEGHFIIFTIGKEYRDLSNPFFKAFSHIRGLTAPMFLTVTGLIFVYLLMNNAKEGWNKERVKKGFKRAGELVIWAYVLQLNFSAIWRKTHGFSHEWKQFTTVYHWNPFDYFISINGGGFYTFHILHCIGFGIAILLVVYFIARLTPKIPIYWYYFAVGTLLLCLYPSLRNWDAQQIGEGPHYFPSGAPAIIQNIFYGERSVFPIIPYAAFVLYGGMLGAIIQRYQAKILSIKTALLFIVIGIIVVFYNASARANIDRLFSSMTGISSHFMEKANMIYGRLGEVIIVLGILILIEAKLTIRDSWFLRMGQNTFPIYVIHYMIIYGGISGFGIDTVYHFVTNPHSFAHHPAFVIGGAILFIATFAHLAKHIDRYNAFFSKVTAKVFFWNKGTLNKSRYYILGGLLASFIVFFLTRVVFGI